MADAFNRIISSILTDNVCLKVFIHVHVCAHMRLLSSTMTHLSLSLFRRNAEDKRKRNRFTCLFAMLSLKEKKKSRISHWSRKTIIDAMFVSHLQHEASRNAEECHRWWKCKVRTEEGETTDARREKQRQLTWREHDEHREFHNELFYTNCEYAIHEGSIMLLNASNKYWLLLNPKSKKWHCSCSLLLLPV